MGKIIIVLSIVISILAGVIVFGIFHYSGRIQSGNELYRQVEITNSRIKDGISFVIRESGGRNKLIEKLRIENTSLDSTIGELQKDNIRLGRIAKEIESGTGRTTEKLQGITETIDRIDGILQEIGKEQNN